MENMQWSDSYRIGKLTRSVDQLLHGWQKNKACSFRGLFSKIQRDSKKKAELSLSQVVVNSDSDDNNDERQESPPPVKRRLRSSDQHFLLLKNLMICFGASSTSLNSANGKSIRAHLDHCMDNWFDEVVKLFHQGQDFKEIFDFCAKEKLCAKVKFCAKIKY